MPRKIALMALTVLPALLLALSALAPNVAAAPQLVDLPSPRPSLTVPAPAGACLVKVFENLERLVIFRCPNGALAFYRLVNGQGDFHSWLGYTTWAAALPGKVAHAATDDDNYQVLFGRASQEDVELFNLAARTPNQPGAWYHVILVAPGGTRVVDDYFYLAF